MFSSMIKTHQVVTEGNFVNLIEGVYKNSSANAILTDGTLRVLPLISETRAESPLLSLAVNTAQ